MLLMLVGKREAMWGGSGVGLVREDHDSSESTSNFNCFPSKTTGAYLSVDNASFISGELLYVSVIL